MQSHVETSLQVWQLTRRPKRLESSEHADEQKEMDHRGSQEPEHESLWGYTNSFSFKSGKWHDLTEVIMKLSRPTGGLTIDRQE